MDITNKFLKNLEIKDFVFYGEPVYHPLEDYKRAINKIKSESTKDNNILSVYTFGGIKNPGISDLDFIYVVKDVSKMPKFLDPILKDKELGYVVFHPFFIINEEIMKKVRYIYTSSDYQLVYGKNIQIESLSKKDHKQALIFLMTDVILRHYPSDFITVLASKRINIRMVLLRLNSLRQSIILYKELKGTVKKEWNEYAENIFKLRKDWFKLDIKKRRNMLVELLKKAVYVSYDFILDFEKLYYSANPGDIKCDGNSNIVFKGTKERLSFIPKIDTEKSINDIIIHFKKYGNFYSILPISFLKQICAYASGNGLLSEYFKKRLNVECKVEHLNPILKLRVDLMNEHVSITNKLKHTHYPCFFPLGYKSTAGIMNKIRYLAILIINSSLFRKIIYPIRDRTKLF